jgi:MazG family protein
LPAAQAAARRYDSRHRAYVEQARDWLLTRHSLDPTRRAKLAAMNEHPEKGSAGAEEGRAHEFERLVAIIRELRVRCPWDREQTISSVAHHVVEEAYEVLDAIGRGGDDDLRDELGDLLVQVVFISVIAAEQSRFSIAEVARAAAQKLIRRHPHVYGDAKADTVEQVLSNWENIKREEKRAAGKDEPFADAGRALPALMRAEKLGIKARRAGMDWAGAREVLNKVREELDEAEAALARGDSDGAASEMGDMMLAIANAPRFIGHNAEATLRSACDKFVARFQAVERLASSRGLDLHRLSPAEVEALWNEAKRTLR